MLRNSDKNTKKWLNRYLLPVPKTAKNGCGKQPKMWQGYIPQVLSGFWPWQVPPGPVPKKSGKGGKNWDGGIFYRRSQAGKMGKGYKYLELCKCVKAVENRPCSLKNGKGVGKKNSPWPGKVRSLGLKRIENWLVYWGEPLWNPQRSNCFLTLLMSTS